MTYHYVAADLTEIYVVDYSDGVGSFINATNEIGETASAALPTEPAELHKLIHAILAAAGMQDMDQDWMPEPR